MINRDKKKVIKILITVVIFCVMIRGMLLLMKESGTSALRIAADFLRDEMEQAYFMPASYIKTGSMQAGMEGISAQIMGELLPLYTYAADKGNGNATEDEMMAEFFMQKEGSDEDRKEIEEDKLDYGKDALHIENSMVAEMQRENQLFLEQQEEAEEENEAEEKSSEQEAASETDEFISAKYPAYTYDWEEQWGYDELVSNFYAVDASTSLKEEYMNLDDLLYCDLSVDRDAKGPQILIYHTHSQEDFVDSVEGDTSTTIVGAGAKLARLLTEEYGFEVMHHTGEYDVENRDYAYSNSLPEIERILKENPSIEVVIDLHRDEMQEGKKLVMDLQGRPTARFMFFDGMSYIRDKGDISYLENPYIQENLAFSFQAQVTANQYYPGIARKIYLKAYRYNLHLCPKSMLIELGAQTNTVEEIMNACDPLAHIISIVLNGEV